MAYESSSLLFWPMLTMVLSIGVYSFCLLAFRVQAVRKRQVSYKYYKTYNGEAPEMHRVFSNHYNNLYQLPVVFIGTCIYGATAGHGTPIIAGLAWCFVVSRWVHTWVHLGSNHVLKRAISFFMGWVFLLGMWGSYTWRILCT